jgi:hypothetical protein
MDAAERKAAAEAAIVAAEVEYAKIVADDESAMGAFAEGVSEILTARSMTPKIVEIVKLFQVTFAEAMDGVSRMEAVGAHIATDYVEYPNGRVELDVVGNLVAVEFDDRVELS